MICLPCRGTRGNAACQPAIKLQWWDNRSALPMRDSRTSVRCALPAHADQKEISAASRLHRRPGSADFCRLQNGVPPSELQASRPRHHASEKWSGRWITLSLAILASVLKCPKRLRTKPFGDVSSELCSANRSPNHRSQLHINTTDPASLPRLQVPLRQWLAPIDISLFMEYRSLLIPC